MNELKTLWKLYHYAQELKPKVIKASVYSITNKVFDLFPPLLIGLAVDTVVKGDQSFLSHYGAATQFDQLLIIAALTVVVWVLESFFEYLFAVEWRELAQAIQHKMRMNCYAHLQHLDHSFFEDQSSGNLISILGEDINQLERFLDVGMNELLQVITTVAVIGGIYFYHSPLLALFSFVTMPFIVWGSVWFQGFLAPLYRDVRDRAGLMTGELSNNLQGISTIKSFARESEDYTKMARFSRDYLEANQKAIKVSALFTPVIRMLVMVGFLVTLLFGGKLTLNGVIEVGTYSTMVFLIQRLLWPLTRLGQTLDLFQRAMASTNRALSLLNASSTIVDGPLVVAPSEVKGQLELKNIGFKYADGNSVLKGITLNVMPRESVGLVGGTGSGKSTLIKLLQRFYDPTSGVIALDGHPLQQYKLHSLRSAISVVSQDVYLFHGSVLENVRFAKPEATISDIQEACRLACLHDFIMELPKGYDTIVGERGQKLSGGQRQRLSIARALIANAPIVILDEATSAVDNVTEAKLQRNLETLLKDKTTIVIAHRLSTVINCDRIFVLEEGQIKEEGRHQDLISNRSTYHDLWNVQTGVVNP